jgi:hypothetical protein
VATWAHLVRRFVGSLRRGGPAPADDAWATSSLTAGEVALWRRMSSADRRHAVGVARAVDAALGPAATPPVRAAALLHDVGKVDAGFGTFRRSAVTAVAMVVGVERARGWRDRPGQVGRAGRYLCHDEIGARLLAGASSDPLTVAWAREHHLPSDRWTVPAQVGAALKTADGD